MLLLAGASATITAGCAAPNRGPSVRVPADSPIDYAGLDGALRVDGSSTVFPISEAVAEEFARVAHDVRVNVGFSGTGGGIEKFCRGDIEVADASRKIKESEIKACGEAGIDDVIEFRIATDALAVVVNPANTWTRCLTVAQLHEVFREGGARLWSDLDPSWPPEAIVIYNPGTDSGTFDYFEETVIARVDKDAVHRGDGTASEDDNILALGIENDRNAIGDVGLAHFMEAGARLRAVAIDGGEGCVAPSEEAALGGIYSPLSRPLLLYTRGSLLGDRPDVLGFIDFYVRVAAQIDHEVGYAALSDEQLADQIATLAPFYGGH